MMKLKVVAVACTVIKAYLNANKWKVVDVKITIELQQSVK